MFREISKAVTLSAGCSEVQVGKLANKRTCLENRGKINIYKGRFVVKRPLCLLKEEIHWMPSSEGGHPNCHWEESKSSMLPR